MARGITPTTLPTNFIHDPDSPFTSLESTYDKQVGSITITNSKSAFQNITALELISAWPIAAMTSNDSAVPVSAFASLPDEVLQQILYYVSPHDILSKVQLVSKRFNRLGNAPLLWRHHCRALFKYWDAKHSFGHKVAGTAGEIDWKALFTYRDNVDLRTTKALNNTLQSRANRIVNFEEVGGFGYDAKDTLLRHCHIRGEDQLARK